MKITILLKKILIAILFLTQFTFPVNIIFDLNGVLVDTDKFASFRALGLTNLASYIWNCKKNPFHVNSEIKDKFFEILDQVAQLNNIDYAPHIIAHDPNGKKLPYYMHQWLKGKMSNNQILTTILESIEAHPEWFEHASEKQLICNLAIMIFTPDTFIATRKIYPQAIAFMKACKQNGHNVYILSNWDEESFEIFKKNNPKFFENVDGYIISGQVKKIKPNTKIYAILLEKYQLKPALCYFIDDQEENISAAKKCDIHGILCPVNKNRGDPDYISIARQIKKLHR